MKTTDKNMEVKMSQIQNEYQTIKNRLTKELKSILDKASKVSGKSISSYGDEITNKVLYEKNELIKTWRQKSSELLRNDGFHDKFIQLEKDLNQEKYLYNEKAKLDSPEADHVLEINLEKASKENEKAKKDDKTLKDINKKLIPYQQVKYELELLHGKGDTDE